MRLPLWRTVPRAVLPWLALAIILALPGSLFARPAAQATIAIFKIASVSEARPGQSFSYSIAVVRDGTEAVTIRDVLDPALVLVNASPSTDITCQAGQTLVCTLAAGEIRAGTVTLLVHARATTPEGTIIPNQASATSGTETVQSVTTSVRINGAPATPIPTLTPSPFPTWTPLPTWTPGPTATATPPGTPAPTATFGATPPPLPTAPANVKIGGVAAVNQPQPPSVPR